MALKSPPFDEVIQQINQLVGSEGLRGEVDRNARLLIQSALQRLDVVTRDEFDTQAELLNRTQARVKTLESELAALTATLDELEARQKQT